ncbi:hypothetical protein D918_08848 [Trichuris suis]|nr:hypothetical protein D918_08848 [Trichuris suis]
MDAVFAYAAALKGAWMTKCQGRPGLCPRLVQMENIEFRRYLTHVQFTHSKDSRSPPSLYGHEVSQRKRKSKVQYDSKGSLLLKQVSGRTLLKDLYLALRASYFIEFFCGKSCDIHVDRRGYLNQRDGVIGDVKLSNAVNLT